MTNQEIMQKFDEILNQDPALRKAAVRELRFDLGEPLPEELQEAICEGDSTTLIGEIAWECICDRYQDGFSEANLEALEHPWYAAVEDAIRARPDAAKHLAGEPLEVAIEAVVESALRASPSWPRTEVRRYAAYLLSADCAVCAAERRREERKGFLAGQPELDVHLLSRTSQPELQGPVPYAGREFSSLSQARWAVFLDALGISWEYFPGSVATFFLPRAGFYLAISEPDTVKLDERSCRDFSGLHRAVFLTRESPGNAFGKLFCSDLTDSSGGSGEFEARMLFGSDEIFFAVEGSRDRTYYADPCFTDQLNVFQVRGDLDAAVAKSRAFPQ